MRSDDPDKARERAEQEEEHEMATEARTEQVRRYTPEPVIPRSIVDELRDIRARAERCAVTYGPETDAPEAAAFGVLAEQLDRALARLERFAPATSIPIGDALDGVGPEPSRRKMAAMGAVLAERLPEIVYVAPERLRSLLAELLAAADTGI